MRYYVLRPGDPPSIRAEFVVEDTEAHAVERRLNRERREGMSGAVELFTGETIALRRELLAVPAHEDALRRWESRDDEAFHAAERGHYRADARKDSEILAQAGCRIAADLIAHGTDEELDDFIPSHVCQVEDCGGSLFSAQDLESV